MQTQISLPPELHEKARRRASNLGLSQSEYRRQLIEHDLELPDRPATTAIFDLGLSGGSNIARDKDQMIGEAIYESRKIRKQTSR
jgi:hypothetical protein